MRRIIVSEVFLSCGAVAARSTRDASRYIVTGPAKFSMRCGPYESKYGIRFRAAVAWRVVRPRRRSSSRVNGASYGQARGPRRRQARQMAKRERWRFESERSRQWQPPRLPSHQHHTTFPAPVLLRKLLPMSRSASAYPPTSPFEPPEF